jgi:hypothetical protein
MKMKAFRAAVLTLSVLACACAHPPEPTQKGRVFELRTYTTSQKLDDFKDCFLHNTVQLFRKYGFEAIGYWVPLDPPGSRNTFVYMLAFPDRETAKARWEAFLNDPDWVKARGEFMAKHGKVTDNIESQFLSPVEFSPMKE